jgi:hypothetical protein
VRTLGALIAVAALVVGACSSGDGDKTAGDATTTTTVATIPEANLQAQASVLTDALIAQKWDEVVSHFDTRMQENLTAAGLKQAWDQVVTAYGPYKARGTPARVHVVSSLTVFDTPMTFGSEPMKSRFSFDHDGKVGGLFILKADAP